MEAERRIACREGVAAPGNTPLPVSGGVRWVGIMSHYMPVTTDRRVSAPLVIAPGRLQRCGGSRCSSAKDVAAERVLRQRDWSSSEPATVPAIVRQALRSPGQPIEDSARNAMESRFGHDFSRVRVHTDAKAAESARTVNARAYTVGREIVFGAGHYAPGTPAGRHLLAHELTHVVQQSGMSEANGNLSLGPIDDPLEREADAVARSDATGDVVKVAGARSEGAGTRLQRQGFGDVRISEGLDAERASEEQTRATEKGPANMSRRILTQGDLDTIQAAVPSIPPPTRVVPGVRGARFVLHDTAALVGAKRIAELSTLGRRSAGEGAGAFVPRDVPATVTHTPFFGPRRPTATQFERGQDIMVKSDREKSYRAVWKEVDKTRREAAVDALLTDQGSPAAEAASERAKAIKGLDAATGDLTSAAAWTVENLCAAVANTGAASLAASAAQAPALDTACKNLSTLTLTRAARTASTVNIEIVAAPGSDCRTTGKLVPLSPYTEGQYNNVAQLYLRAAFEAKFFPEVTTHFLMDKGVGDHCDPRCFRLQYLYDKIAALMKHGKGTTYGIAPSYGTGAAHNVWWNDTVCGGAHP